MTLNLLRRKFNLYAGLDGGLGEATLVDFGYFEDEEDALFSAYDLACQMYDDIAGLHGIRDIEQIMEEDEVDWYEADNIYNEERENHIDYYVKEVSEDDISSN